MKYLRTHKKDENTHTTKHEDHYIPKCGDCPDQLSLFCVRKHVFIEKGTIYKDCPLPNY